MFYISYVFSIDKGWKISETELPIQSENKKGYYLNLEGTNLEENWVYLRGDGVLKKNQEWSYENGHRVLGYLNYHGDFMQEYFEVDVVTNDKEKAHEDIKKIIKEIAENKIKKINDRLIGLDEISVNQK